MPSRLGGFMPRVSADVHQLAEKARHDLLARPDVQKLRGVQWRENTFNPGDDTLDYYARIHHFLQRMPDEGFKLMPWVVREFKNRGINENNYAHALDILSQATKWIVWSKEHNKPLPDMMSKLFGFVELEGWVYKMNNSQADAEGQWHDSKPVYTWPDGWHMDLVGSGDLALEGELMGHCVGGYCHAVDSGNSIIYSLRDPKGHPHVTIEVAGDSQRPAPHERPGHWNEQLNVVQVQGKSDTEPIPEYRQRVDDWYDHLRTEGWYVEEHDPDREPEVEYVEHYDGPYHLEEPEDILDYHHTMNDQVLRDQAFGDDEEGNWDEPNVVTYTNPRRLVLPDGGDTLAPVVTQYVQSLMTNRRNASQDEITRFVQGLWIAVRHLDQTTYHGGGPDYWKMHWRQLIQRAHDVADQVDVAPKPSKQPTLFDPEEFGGQRPIPPAVQSLIRYMEELENAPEQYQYPVLKWQNNPTTRQMEQVPTGEIGTRNGVHMPGTGGWPVTDFNDYFNHIGMPGPTFAGTFARYVATAPLIAKLIKSAHTTDWSFNPAGHEDEVTCPLDGQELDIHFHGGASCPQCGTEYEVGRNGVVLPSDHSVSEMSEQWPDTLPWSEAEQGYYRSAKAPESAQEPRSAPDQDSWSPIIAS